MWQELKFWPSWMRWREAREEDLERELRDHLDLEAEEQREAGLSSKDAEHAARRALGNELKIKEDVRMAWGFQWLKTLASFGRVPAYQKLDVADLESQNPRSLGARRPSIKGCTFPFRLRDCELVEQVILGILPEYARILVELSAYARIS
jgi:hypothetical protein